MGNALKRAPPHTAVLGSVASCLTVTEADRLRLQLGVEAGSCLPGHSDMPDARVTGSQKFLENCWGKFVT